MKQGSSPLRILTNTTWFTVERNHVAWQVRYEPRRWRRYFLILGGSWDAIVINSDRRSVLLACLRKKLAFFSSTVVVAVDLVLMRPGRRHPLRLAIVKWLLKELAGLLLYYRETSDLRALYGLSEAQVRYIPFKVNTLDQVLTLTTCNEGFFLSCGQSFRDYATLCEAFSGLRYECKLLAAWDRVAFHGTNIGDLDLPPQVACVSDDGSTDSWNAWIARCLAVVLPIEPGILSPAGISTYLVAMALGKCVIITEGPATKGLLTNGEAVLVPPRDAASLRDVVVRVAEDSAYREAIAEAGRRYALSLGGEERLAEDVVREVLELVTVPHLTSQ